MPLKSSQRSSAPERLPTESLLLQMKEVERMRSVVLALILLATVAPVLPGPRAKATALRGGVDAQAMLTPGGRSVTVSGIVDCSQSGDRPVLLRVTLTQAGAPTVVEVPPSQFGPPLLASTQPIGGVVLEGLWQKQCSAAAVAWSVTLNVAGDSPLSAGPADVAVLDYTDAVQWIGQTQLAVAG
jgi:hypothetical protein